MKECPKCTGSDISVVYHPVNETQPFNRLIDGIKKFMQNDSYYTSDTVKMEHLIYTCDRCGYKKADVCSDSKS